MKSALTVIFGILLIMTGIYPFVSQDLAAMLPQLTPFICPVDEMITLLAGSAIVIGVHLALSVTRAYRLLVQYTTMAFAMLIMLATGFVTGEWLIGGGSSNISNLPPTYENIAILGATFVLGLVLYREGKDQVKADKPGLDPDKVLLITK